MDLQYSNNDRNINCVCTYIYIYTYMYLSQGRFVCLGVPDLSLGLGHGSPSSDPAGKPS